MNRKYLLEVYNLAKKADNIHAMLDTIAFASSHKIKLKGK